MSLSVPQNGVKADSEPVIELFVKVRPQDKFFSFSLSLSHLAEPTSAHCALTRFISASKASNVRDLHK